MPTGKGTGQITEDKRIADVLEFKRKLKEATDTKYALYNQAVSLTITTYHLEPAITTAPKLYSGPGEINVKPWYPFYSEKEVPGEGPFMRRRTDPEALERGRKAGNPPGILRHTDGMTSMEDAKMRIFQHAFYDSDGKPDPGDLAATIYHETVHWLDNAGRGKKFSPFEYCHSEDRAYSLTADQAKVFELSKELVDLYQASSANNRARALHTSKMTWEQVAEEHPEWFESVSLGETSPAAFEPGEPGRPEPDRAAAEADFRRVIEEMRGLSQESKQVVQKHLEAQQRRREDEFKRQKDVRDESWRYLRTVVGLACSDPQALAGQIAEDRVVSVGLPAFQIQAFLVIDWDSLSGCQRFLIANILAGKGAIPAGTLVAWSDQFHRDNPGIIDRLLTSLGDFFKALGDYRESEPRRSGGIGGGGSKEKDREDGSERPNDDTHPSRQLKGIESGGWKGH